MTTDLRYDGPDLESEAGQRTSSAMMGGTMALDGLTTALSSSETRKTAKRSQAEAEALAADQAVWRDTPSGPELSGLADESLARRWIAAAAHPDQPDANEVRGRIEAELDRRDPETMRDYRSWRNAANQPPGEAMRRALAEREQRLAGVWGPLAGGAAATMTQEQVTQAWAAAHASLGEGPALDEARAAGFARLRELDPDLADGWVAAQLPQPSTVKGLGERPGLSAGQAAARTTGRAGAFVPGPVGQAGWAQVAAHGVKVAKAGSLITPAGVATAGKAGVEATKRLLDNAATRAVRQ